MIHPQRWVVVKEVITKDDIWFQGWISGQVCEISDVGIHNKIDTQKRNDQLLSLGPEKSWPAMTHSNNYCTLRFMHSNIYKALDR
jgi:hypothetical protein